VFSISDFDGSDDSSLEPPQFLRIIIQKEDSAAKDVGGSPLASRDARRTKWVGVCVFVCARDDICLA
jgi:hypothetical protein